MEKVVKQGEQTGSLLAICSLGLLSCNLHPADDDSASAGAPVVLVAAATEPENGAVDGANAGQGS